MCCAGKISVWCRSSQKKARPAGNGPNIMHPQFLRRYGCKLTRFENAQGLVIPMRIGPLMRAP